MNTSTRFTVALHVLTLLALMPEHVLTSEFIAGSVNTNPVVVRRLLGALRKRGIVSSQPGNGGGWQLAVPPATLTLLAVRRAIEEGSPFAMHNQEPNPLCPVGRNIQQALGPIYEEAEQALEEKLEQQTILSLLQSIQQAR